MTEKRFTFDGKDCFDNGEFWLDLGLPTYSNIREICNMLNELAEENELLKKDRFICLDCEHSGYMEIGCLCEKEDHWTDYKTECEDYEELE